jgi:translation initiation factor IF-2
VVWSFRTSPVVAGTCQLGVFVPTGNSQQDVAGKPAWYRVSGGGTFTVDQVANRGSWVSAGTFPVRDGLLSITLLTRGADPGNEHLAAAQTRISCRTSARQ